MTLRKLWLLVLVLVTVLAISINTLILTFLTDNYFSDYMKESYDLHVGQIIDYTTAALSSESVSFNQMAIELESHINDPIIKIKLYGGDGRLLVDVGDDDYMDTAMMTKMMNSRMMGRRSSATSEDTRQFEITDNGEVLGIMNITIHSLAENSFVARRFKAALMTNSLSAFLIAVFIASFIGVLVSRRMSRSLKETERLASDIQLGKKVDFSNSGIKEINAIRESLLELNVRLKLKQKTRKSLIDQLVHQTRTPLTILQSHIEGIEDGLIEVDAKELTICQNQIADITSMIANMSSVIDADPNMQQVQIESFEFQSLVKQIQEGLMAQFQKKDIQLTIVSDEKVTLKTDKYKLSQAIYNLLTNAYKYTKAYGTVSISYFIVDGSLKVSIQDTGIGISEEALDKVFEAYYREANDLEVKGDGLGLYIVKENVSALQGEISIDSSVGEGSIFTISIPLEYDSNR